MRLKPPCLSYLPRCARQARAHGSDFCSVETGYRFQPEVDPPLTADRRAAVVDSRESTGIRRAGRLVPLDRSPSGRPISVEPTIRSTSRLDAKRSHRRIAPAIDAAHALTGSRWPSAGANPRQAGPSPAHRTLRSPDRRFKGDGRRRNCIGRPFGRRPGSGTRSIPINPPVRNPFGHRPVPADARSAQPQRFPSPRRSGVSHSDPFTLHRSSRTAPAIFSDTVLTVSDCPGHCPNRTGHRSDTSASTVPGANS